MNIKSPLILFLIFLMVIIIYSTLGPSEATLGSNARIVYLHGAWVWVSLITFIVSGITGLLGLIRQFSRKSNKELNQWSRALGRTGLFYWITYLPISMWAMQANWNGLFLAEPRWRIAVIFAIAGVLLQLGLSLLPAIWASFWNTAYVIILFFSIRATENVMHPPSPILDSNAWRIQIFFVGLTLLLLGSAWQVSRGFKSLEN